MSEARLANQRKALDALHRAGAYGVPTEALAKIAGLRFGARIFELRQEGWDIETKPRHGKEVACYILHGRKHPGQLGLFEGIDKAA
jgi:hypothetical protein